MTVTAATAEPPEPSLRGTALAGALAVAIGFGGFAGWAWTADLDSAAIATGTVIVDTHRKTVSHLEGGILAELLVREGDLVEAGQPLLRLESIQSRALVAQVHSQLWPALARTARLRAERAESAAVDFPAELLEAARSSEVAADAMEAERRLMVSRRQAHDGQIGVLRARIAQFREEADSVRAQRAATADRLRLTEEELRTVRGLYERGYERKPRLLELQRMAAELLGKQGELAGALAQAEQGIAGAELEIANLRNTRLSEILDELQKSQTSVADFSERLRGASDVLRRQVITAPQAGRVTNLRYFTPGGVIQSAAPILDVVPLDEEKVVEAKVSVTDIDVVHVGRPAMVRLTAYKQRTMIPVDGTVVAVSADQLVDERSGHPYFMARVRLEPAALAALPGIELYPGMPAEVLIRGTARKAIDYFLAPITDGLRRALREE